MAGIPKDSMHLDGRKVGKIALAVGPEALQLAEEVAKKATSKLALKAAAAAPAVGVAAAVAAVAWDAADCYEARNQKASAAKIGAACLAMVGSTAAATQIPFVSQVGIGISVISTLAEPEK